MLINVEDIPVTGKRLAGEIREQSLNLNMKLLTPVNLDGKISKSGEDVFINGQINTIIEVSCHRCLKHFSQKVDTSFELFCQPVPVNEQNDYYEITPEELGISYYQDNTIDLSNTIRDTIILEIPIKLLCSDDCNGLCTECGNNLNKNQCCCANEKESYNPFKEFFQG